MSLSKPKKILLSAVDVFSGIGGMSAGAASAGFKIKAAIEIDREAVRTYKANHHGVTVIESDIREVTSSKIAEYSDGQLDLIMGCAPCQGFCSLTSKWGREDERNLLVLELARLAEELNPRAIVMENVPGLLTRGNILFSQLKDRLIRAGYKLTWSVIQMADYGVPQNRKRLVLIGARDFQPTFPMPTHSGKPDKSGVSKPWLTLKDAIYGLPAPKKLSASQKSGGPQSFNWHIVRELRPETLARLKAAMPGESRMAISKNLLPSCHQDGYTGFRNVYTRMEWQRPSPTITAGCLTPAKGRFGHPDRRRTTISVREAARIQTFPDSFVLETAKIDSACQMIGNAVPPAFSEALLKHLRTQLLESQRERHDSGSSIKIQP